MGTADADGHHGLLRLDGQDEPAFLEFLQDPVRAPAILARIPAGRWGMPADLQGAVVFLASEASAYVNGFTVAVDGGWLGR
jgi:NAD(P)-dependent dehydrogenase (short-subunit alcohol dehydrogenase family)